MKKIVSLICFFTAVAMLVLVVSCTQGACFEETNSFLGGSFYSNLTKKPLTPDSLTLSGKGETNKIYDRAQGVTLASFPLNSSADRCTFLIKINGVEDTLQFIYTSYPHLISKECGYTFYHRLDTFFYSTNTIDYIYRNSNNVTTVNEENIRIYY